MKSQTDSTPDKNQYLLLFRGTDWSKTLSPEEMQQVASQWMAWFKRLSEQGKVLGGSPLDIEGRVVSGKNGRTISDGPFAESKEAIGGYFLLQVETMDEAVAIAQQCPGLPHGAKVEVRHIIGQCPVSGVPVPQIELSATHA
ncbi:MAG TPA: YciI family protein [Pseudomonadales bacterium]|nr:YciI family protein [Pseudomonadales bacterium]